ncbi:RHS repeat-associated core domain-containing protein [Pseudomonas parafulva]|uniref:RHS repeat-associated core domain-containing protein n=1 Tax=Pseudomonas parafulva TaxID=157782 RepID=UPI00068E75D4|nr:RHS repeat-associated core domain-containing protein [Pseudomonas parafulva]
MGGELFHQTPSVRVYDNRRLPVRQIEYYRCETLTAAAEIRIARHGYGPAGLPSQMADPRLHAAGRVNFLYRQGLARQTLRVQSADAGTRLTLDDCAGRGLFAVSQVGVGTADQDDFTQAVMHRRVYELPTQAGRLLSVSEQVVGAPARVSERLCYAGHSAADKDRNLSGDLVSHYDPAGRLSTQGKALVGTPTCVSRQLLREADDVDVHADWRGDSAQDWDRLLDTDAYRTCSGSDATGRPLWSLDCAGHRQRSAYDVAGALNAAWLTLESKPERAIVVSVDYSAQGRKLREAHGNGAVTVYRYQPRTSWLASIQTLRQAVPQQRYWALDYRYDPVGNVIGTSNDAEPTRFWRNQRVAAECEYRYDSLYQLVFASGREMVNVGREGNLLPEALVPLPVDDSLFTRYTRRFTYDSAGNLIRIQHSAPATNNHYVTAITVSPRSNRGVWDVLCEQPEGVEAQFTAGGGQRALLPGQGLAWTARGELRQVLGEGVEHYRYDAGGQRVLKVCGQRQGPSLKQQQVMYLPGVELHLECAAGDAKERVHVVVMGEAGNAQVRAMRCRSQVPERVDHDDIRYFYDDVIGSVGLELDAEGEVISREAFYPFGGTASLVARHQIKATDKAVRYSGRERDAGGLYHYGHRYYQPWTGRWLSADPAGGVDGANLYAMVRNSPVTYFDAAGLISMSMNLDQGRGDLVYGISTHRHRYLAVAIDGYEESQDDVALTIDHYNIAVAKAVLSYALIKFKLTITAPPRHLLRAAAPSTKNFAVARETFETYVHWDRYFAVSQHSPKFNIPAIYESVATQWETSRFHNWIEGDVGPLLFWKRGSKLGLHMATNQEGPKIHFILDDLIESAVIDKSGEFGQSVTASELRYAFRNRAALGGQIHFYKGGLEVPAPWHAAPWRWSAYKPHSEPRGRYARWQSLRRERS